VGGGSVVQTAVFVIDLLTSRLWDTVLHAPATDVAKFKHVPRSDTGTAPTPKKQLISCNVKLLLHETESLKSVHSTWAPFFKSELRV
jgi:hypothetical protein